MLLVMAAIEHYLELTLEAKSKYTKKNESFEEHFIWLEEALVAARQSFAHAEQTLLPKTPAIKKRGRAKKRDSSPILEEGESPSKKLSVESTKSQDETQSPECPPARRGRAASRLAQEKVKKNLKENIRCKLRRPSTPVDNSRTTKKTTGTRRVEENRNQTEIESSISEGKENIPEKQTDRNFEKSQCSTLPVDREDLQNEEEKPKKLNTESRRNGSIVKKRKSSQLFEEETKTEEEINEPMETHPLVDEKKKMVIKEKSETDTDNVGKYGATINDDGDGRQESSLRACSSKRDSAVGERNEKPSSRKSLTGVLNSFPLNKTDSNLGVYGTVKKPDAVEMSEKECENSRPTPVPKVRSTRTKCKDVKISSSSVEQVEVFEPSISSPQPVPKPRTTRTKRLESRVDSCTAENEMELVPPQDQQKSTPVEEETKQADINHPPPKAPKVQSIHTKKKPDDSGIAESLKQNSVSEAESVGEENSGSQCLTSSVVPPDVPKARSTRTKKKPDDSGTAESLKHLSASEAESVGEEDSVSQCLTSSFVPPDVPKARSIRTKKKPDDSGTAESLKHLSASEAESVGEEDSGSQCSTSSFVPPDVPKARLTRTKKKQTDDGLLSDGSVSEAPKPRSTRTKKKMDEGAKDESTSEDIHLQSETGSTDGSCAPQSRTTRTKKRQGEDQANQPARTTRTKRRKVEDEENKENSLAVSSSPESRALSLIKKYQTNIEKSVLGEGRENNDANKTCTKRLTRSKVRQVAQVTKASPRKASPYCTKKFESPGGKEDFQRDCCSPKFIPASPKKCQPVVSRLASPLQSSPHSFKNEKTGYSSKATYKKPDGHAGVEEIKSSDIEVTKTPARITRHSGGKATRTPNSKLKRINPQPTTPSPQCPTEKIVRTKLGHILSGSSSYGSSGRITPKTYSRIKPGLMNSASSSSTEYHKTMKKTNTPNEVNRTKNIVSGVASFIKVHPPKPSREELEEKRQIELQKKRERENETRKKKEEILKSKVEEQKKRNEERMRRAKEAREEKERKAEEAKELQKTERRQREERLKEEQQKKKQQMLARKQAEEEAKARKLKEQMEEERRRLEEIRLAEEARKAEEEAKRVEEERRVEQERLKEEERRKKRVAEVERIARERKEMEQLKLREAERLAAARKAKLSPLQKVTVNKTVHNSTFTKGSAENKENSGNHNATFTKNNPNTTFSTNSGSNEKHGSSYEMTPDHKKTKAKKHTAHNSHNYNITDIKSDDSTDDEAAPKKQVPTWAQGNQLKASLINQEYYPPDISSIFPPEELLTMPDLMQIFPVVRRRFFKRTSSAIWTTPPSKLMD